MPEVNSATRPAGPSQASRLAGVRMASFGAVTMLIRAVGARLDYPM